MVLKALESIIIITFKLLQTVLKSREYEPDDPETLLAAFKVLKNPIYNVDYL